MGGSVGAETGGRSVDVELNVVPFIDLLSCLTAFLLVTAVWSQYSQINIKPKGLGRDVSKPNNEEPPPQISVLITKDEIWIGQTLGDRRQIAADGEGYDWTNLEDVLKEYKESAVFADRSDIEVAAEDDVTYQHIINAMDTAIATEFRDIGFVDPQSLSVRFKE